MSARRLVIPRAAGGMERGKGSTDPEHGPPPWAWQASAHSQSGNGNAWTRAPAATCLVYTTGKITQPVSRFEWERTSSVFTW